MSGSTDNTVILWDLNTLSLVRQLSVHPTGFDIFLFTVKNFKNIYEILSALYYNCDGYQN